MGEIISIIYEYPNEQVLREVAEGTEENPSQFNVPVIRVTEMLDNMYHTLIDSELVSDFEDALKFPPDKMIFVGSYLQSGEQFIWTEPTEKQRNHSINKYKGKLNDVIEYDEDGNETGSHRPTEAEALNTQVNKILGQTDRELE